jgi:hypothetical protein
MPRIEHFGPVERDEPYGVPPFDKNEFRHRSLVLHYNTIYRIVSPRERGVNASDRRRQPEIEGKIGERRFNPL